MGKRICGLGVVAGFLLFSSIAAAQEEQWLQYRTGHRPWYTPNRIEPADMTTTPPAGVELPPLKSPWFGKIQFGDKGLWVALDDSGAGKGYDTLYIDANFDGKLSDEKPIQARDAYTSGNRTSGVFEGVKLRVASPDGPATYDVNVDYNISPPPGRPSTYVSAWTSTASSPATAPPGRPIIYVVSACWYEGAVNIDGVKYLCQVADGTSNGLFNDRCDSQMQGDYIRLAPLDQKDVTRGLFDPNVRMLGKYIQMEGEYHVAGNFKVYVAGKYKYYEVAVAPDGAWVKFTPAQVQTGQVTLPEGIDVSLCGPEGTFLCMAADGKASLPVGKYFVLGSEMVRKDANGATWKIGQVNFDPAQRVEVRMGQVAAAPANPPTFQFTARHLPDGQYSLSAVLLGGMGGASIQRNGSQPPGPKVHITNADNTFHQLVQLGYG